MTGGRVPQLRSGRIVRVVVLLLLAAAVVWLGRAWLQQTREREQAEALALARSQADALSAYAAGRLTRPRQRLAALEGDLELAEALLAGDTDTLTRREADIAGALPGVLAVRLLPPGLPEPEPDARPPLGYAAIELLRQAQADGPPVPAEALFPGTPDAHIAMVGRLRGVGGQPVGVVHLALDSSWLGGLNAALETVHGGSAAYTLYQLVDGSAPVELAQAGTADAGAAAVEVPVSGSRWVVAVQPSATGWMAGLARQIGVPTAALDTLLPVTAALLLLLLAALAGRRPAAVKPAAASAPRPAAEPAPAPAAPRAEATAPTAAPVPEDTGGTTLYGGALVAIREGSHPGLERLVPGLPGAPKRAPRAPAPPPGASGAGTGEATDTEALIDFGMQQSAEVTRSPLESIFRSYDVRAVAEEALDDDVVYALGRAIGSEVADRGQQAVVVARDGRLSSPRLVEALIKGLEDSGREVIDIGLAPAPVLYFATHYLDTRSGVMVTGSHNGPEYNGFKIVLDGEDLCGETLQALRARIERKDYVEGTGSTQQAEMITEYIRRVSEDIPVALGNPLKIVVDCGNAVSGAVAPSLLRALGHDVIELFCELDGRFPNHHPDPGQPENMVQLVYRVLEEKADLGLAFDGDGDRLGVVDSQGDLIWPDRQLMLLAREVLSQNPGAEVVFDVKCSRHLGRAIEAAGGRPVMCKTGRAFVKQRMREGGAPLAGEFSGHLFFSDRWYGFDDAFYAAARLIEIIMADGRPAGELLGALPDAVATPEVYIPLPEADSRAVVEKLVAESASGFDGAGVCTVDGLRVDFEDGFGLVRPSNTTPALVMRFEGDDEQALQRIRQQICSLVRRVAPDLELPF